jgi:hypothetical protein
MYIVPHALINGYLPFAPFWMHGEVGVDIRPNSTNDVIARK